MKLLTYLILAAGLAVAQVPPPHPVFDKDAVHEIRLNFPDPDWYQTLTDNYDGVRAENPYFPAAITWGDYKFETVGVRFKGNSTYSATTTKKKPFRIKLNEFTKGQKIEGMASFSLSNAWNDPSFVREKIYYEMAAAFGIKAPRSNFAALYINDTYWGLYVLTEVVNSDFLKNYFGKGEDTGNMYKGNIGATFGYPGDAKDAYTSAWEKQSNEEEDDWTDLIALCKLINDTPAEDLKKVLEPLMDIDSVLAAFALDNATVNLDSYVGMGQNFNIYRRPSDKRWVWIPWDPSLAFGALSQGQDLNGMKTLTLEWSNTGGGLGGGGFPPIGPGGPGLPPGGGGGTAQVGRPLATKLWANTEYKQRYRQIYQQLVDKIYHGDEIKDRMNSLREMIRPWVEQDTQKLVTMEQFENAMTTDTTGGPGGGGPGGPGLPPGGGGRQGAGIPGLNGFIDDRLASITSQLAADAIPTVAIATSATTITLAQSVSGKAPTQNIDVTINGTSLPANYTVTATTESGGNWLVATPTGGAIPGALTITTTGKLDPGVYKATVNVHSPAATNSPLPISVTLTVTP
ncbi:MAG: CotH kinase family protein [Acidobacteria bacterium]|nr:CotH kinase family protein [Acidobacteriota bacterium]